MSVGHERTNPQRSKPSLNMRAPQRGRERRQVRRSLTGIILSMNILAGAFALLAWALFDGRLPLVAFVVILAANIGALITYAADKSAAAKGNWRVSEARLHFMEVLGGWPAALVAQQLLRHKTRKLSFQVGFWTAAFTNATVLAFIMFPSLTPLLKSAMP